MVERRLAKAKVAGSSPVIRSKKREGSKSFLLFFCNEEICEIPKNFAQQNLFDVGESAKERRICNEDANVGSSPDQKI